jgi:serine/threonine protein kinase
MPSERIQRRIDSLLDQAEEAADQEDWPLSIRRAREALALDDSNSDAPVLINAAETMLAGGTPESASAAVDAPPLATPQPDARSSFVGGCYEVREFLGEGGKKRVFLAHDSLLDREVAFALIRTEGLDDAGRERITREAQAMGRLGDHPHIVPVLDLDQEEVNGVSHPYIVSQYMAGGSAKDVLAEADGDLPLARTLSLAMDVCRGLQAAHGDNIVHRDLSLGNVWLAEDGTAKIGDFGLAVSPDRTRLTQAGMMVGTATHMPPEQALSGAVTPQSDLYSLGVMLYELVTGRAPFVGDDPTAVISQHINTPPVAPSWHSEHCPPDLEANGGREVKHTATASWRHSPRRSQPCRRGSRYRPRWQVARCGCASASTRASRSRRTTTSSARRSSSPPASPIARSRARCWSLTSCENCARANCSTSPRRATLR